MTYLNLQMFEKENPLSKTKRRQFLLQADEASLNCRSLLFYHSRNAKSQRIRHLMHPVVFSVQAALMIGAWERGCGEEASDIIIFLGKMMTSLEHPVYKRASVVLQNFMNFPL